MSKHVASGRFSTLALATALTGLAALSAPAFAEEAKKDDAAKEVFVARLFAGPVSKPKNYACFVRVYDADHLARHKLQKVAAMKLLVTAEKPQEKSEDGDKMSYGFQLGVKFRSRSTAYESAGFCSNSDLTENGEPGGQLHFGCGVDCDGGGIAIALKNDDKSAIVSLESVRIWASGKDDDPEKAESLSAGADDKEFRLDRAPLSECAPLISDKKERAAMLRMSKELALSRK